MLRDHRRIPAVLTLVALAMTGANSLASTSDFLSVGLKELFVRVELSGMPLTGLELEDFRLSINGEPVPIVTAVEIARDVEAGAAQLGPSTPPRKIILLFDREFTEGLFVDRAREESAGLLLDGSFSGDLISVAQYSRAQGLQVSLPFTTDRRQAVFAMTNTGVTEEPEAEDALGLVLSGTPTGTAKKDEKQEKEPRPVASRSVRQVRGPGPHDRSLSPDAVSRATQFLEAAAGFARRLQAVPGHKQLVFLSRGIDDRLLFGGLRAQTPIPQGGLARRGDPATANGSSQLRLLTFAHNPWLQSDNCNARAHARSAHGQRGVFRPARTVLHRQRPSEEHRGACDGCWLGLLRFPSHKLEPSRHWHTCPGRGATTMEPSRFAKQAWTQVPARRLVAT